MNTPPINSALCIAGAHRSGTSMVTRLLHSCGLDLGEESDWMPARADNPDGFWENLNFVAINDEVLNELGGAWDLPPAFGADFDDARLEPQRQKARLQLEKFDAIPRWGWKDPRNCLTFRFWQKLVPQLTLLLVVRNPLEAAYSMRKRNGTSYSFALRLWEIYNSWLLQACPVERLLVTHYDAFFQDPQGELNRIAEFTGLPTSSIRRSAAVVMANKRHTRFTLEQMIDARVATPVLELYQQLIARSRERRASPIELKPLAEILPGSANRLNVSVPEAEDIRRELSWLRGAEIKLAQRDGQISALKENVVRLEENVVRLERQSHQHEMLADRLLEATKKFAWYLKETETAAKRLRTSRRWKLSNPFGALRELLGGRKLPGYGHLDKIVSDYATWRAAHPELKRIAQGERNQPRRAANRALKQNGSVTSSVELQVPTRPIRFPENENGAVEVSIVIPAFNQLRFTQACLASIEEHQKGQSIEVIVVDDASTDETGVALGKIPGLIYLRNEKNAGFVASCNHGAARARGEYLVFLNNDTLVTADWLSSLLETFQLEPEAGLVGSKLIYPDGRLQEAGGIIWRDAFGWNRGKFGDPDDPEFNFLREVDYCSGACVMVPRSLFEEVGGFDRQFAPGYYEDTDLAFKIRAGGKKVLYQPLSEIIHFEGATGGTDTSSGAKRFQEVNRDKFQSKWSEVLAAKPASGDTAGLAQLGPDQKRILVIDHQLPMPDRDSGSLRMFSILTILSRLGHRVTFLPSNLAENKRYSDELRKRGIEVIVRPYVKNAREYLQNRGSMLDVVILSRCRPAERNLADVRQHAPQSHIIFDTVDLHFVRISREAEMNRTAASIKDAAVTREQELALIGSVDETWVVSETERKLLLPEVGEKKIEVVSNIVEVVEPRTSFTDRSNLLFIGSFLHPPNVDAVLFYAREIHPLVLEQLPRVKFSIIGDKVPPEVSSLADETIVVTGAVPDVRPYFEAVRLSVAPLRYGAGVKGKINQSMGLGVPVVATSAAVEGMSLIEGEDVLVADDPAQFAERVVELYNSEEIWTRLSANGLKKTRALYSPDVARQQLSRLFSTDHHLRNFAREATPVGR